MASGWNLWVWLPCTITVGPLENKNKKPKWRFLTSRGTHINCAIMAMLYTHSIGNQP